MKSNKKILSLLISGSIMSFILACNTINNVNINSQNSVNSANKPKNQYIFDIGKKGSKNGATLRIALNSLKKDNSAFSTQALPLPKVKTTDIASYKVWLTTNPDDPENNLVNPSPIDVTDTSDTTVTFLNVPPGGPYYAYISIYDSGSSNITEPNRKILLGAKQAYVSKNKVSVSSDIKLSFLKADNSPDPANYLMVDLAPRAAVPSDEDFNPVYNDGIVDQQLSPTMSLTESGDGLIVFVRKVPGGPINYEVYARKVENFIPVGTNIRIDVDPESIATPLTNDPTPAISLDKNGTGYIIWSYKISGNNKIKVRKINTFIPDTDSASNYGIISAAYTNIFYEKRNPDVKVNPDDGRQGMFVWTETESDTNGDIVQRSIDNTYNMSAITNVNTVTSSYTQDNAKISRLNNSGNGVIVWEDGRNPGGTGKDVYLKTVTGFITSSSETIINESDGPLPPSNQYSPFADVDENGNGLVAWIDERFLYGDSIAIFTRKISNNALSGSENLFMNYSSAYGKLSLVVKDAILEEATLVYQKYDSDYNIMGVNIRGFSTPANPPYLVNKVNGQSGDQTNPVIALNKKGTALVAWNDDRSSNPEVYARHMISMYPVKDVNEVNPFGVIAYYPFSYASGDNSYYSSFSQGIKDMSGNNRNGFGGHSEPVPSIAPTVDRLGYNNRALTFNSSSGNYVSIPNSDGYFALKKQFSFSIWANVNGASQNWSDVTNDMSILSNFEDGGYALQMNSTEVGAGNIGVIAKINGSVAKVTAPLANLNPGIHHFAATYDGKNLNFYIDGSIQIPSYDAGSIKPVDYTYPNNDLIIGGEAGSASTPESGKFFDGTIDDVRIYDFALNTNEVIGLFSQEGFNNSPP